MTTTTNKKLIVTEEAPLRRRLEALGLDLPTLHEVVRRGAAAKLAATAFHPPSAGGFFQFAELVVAFREALCTPLRGWEPDDTANFCTVVSPDGTTAIAVAGGDAATGDPTREPSTEHPKGPLTTAAVEANQLVLPSVAALKKVSKGPTTWWLLVAVTASDVVAELSLPEAVSDAGWITSWKTRLILPPYPIDRLAGVAPEGDDHDGGEVIDINITKRDD
jgi:hypothetical protein